MLAVLQRCNSIEAQLYEAIEFIERSGSAPGYSLEEALELLRRVDDMAEDYVTAASTDNEEEAIRRVLFLDSVLLSLDAASAEMKVHIESFSPRTNHICMCKRSKWYYEVYEDGKTCYALADRDDLEGTEEAVIAFLKNRFHL